MLAALAVAATVQARIPRDRTEVRAFRSVNACPATGQARGACPGYHVDHIIALCAGGPILGEDATAKIICPLCAVLNLLPMEEMKHYRYAG